MTADSFLQRKEQVDFIKSLSFEEFTKYRKTLKEKIRNTFNKPVDKNNPELAQWFFVWGIVVSLDLEKYLREIYTNPNETNTHAHIMRATDLIITTQYQCSTTMEKDVIATIQHLAKNAPSFDIFKKETVTHVIGTITRRENNITYVGQERYHASEKFSSLFNANISRDTNYTQFFCEFLIGVCMMLHKKEGSHTLELITIYQKEIWEIVATLFFIESRRTPHHSRNYITIINDFLRGEIMSRERILTKRFVYMVKGLKKGGKSIEDIKRNVIDYQMRFDFKNETNLAPLIEKIHKEQPGNYFISCNIYEYIENFKNNT